MIWFSTHRLHKKLHAPTHIVRSSVLIEFHAGFAGYSNNFHSKLSPHHRTIRYSRLDCVGSADWRHITGTNLLYSSSDGTWGTFFWPRNVVTNVNIANLRNKREPKEPLQLVRPHCGLSVLKKHPFFPKNIGNECNGECWYIPIYGLVFYLNLAYSRGGQNVIK